MTNPASTLDAGGWPEFTLVTARQLGDELAAVAHAVHEFAVPALTVFEFAGADAYIYSTDGEGPDAETVIAWSPGSDRVAVIQVVGLSEAESIAFVESLAEVEGDIWRSALEGGN